MGRPKDPPHNVGLFVDASLCPQTRAGGWGAWVARDGLGSVFLSAAFRGPMNSSNDAELCGIACAVHAAAKAGMIARRDVVLIQCDNSHALTALRGHLGAGHRPMKAGLHIPDTRHPISPLQREAVDYLRSIVTDQLVNILVRHVKGHTGKDDGRSWVNKRCDQMAKKHMREGRARLGYEA